MVGRLGHIWCTDCICTRQVAGMCGGQVRSKPCPRYWNELNIKATEREKDTEEGIGRKTRRKLWENKERNRLLLCPCIWKQFSLVFELSAFNSPRGFCALQWDIMFGAGCCTKKKKKSNLYIALNYRPLTHKHYEMVSNPVNLYVHHQRKSLITKNITMHVNAHDRLHILESIWTLNCSFHCNFTNVQLLIPKKQSRLNPTGAILPSTGDKRNTTWFYFSFLVGLNLLLYIISLHTYATFYTTMLTMTYFILFNSSICSLTIQPMLEE